MNSQILFPHIGKVIASTGSRSFPRMLHDLIRTQLAVDATHITQMRVYSEGPQPRNARDEVYSDSTLAPSGKNPTARPAETAAQLHLTSHKDDYRYVISVYRSCQSQSFSHQERILLQDFSPLLLPMVEKHLAALQPHNATGDDPEAAASLEHQGLETLRLRFAARLRQSGLKLSNREMQVCVGLLAGRTAPRAGRAIEAQGAHRRELPQAGGDQDGDQRAPLAAALDVFPGRGHGHPRPEPHPLILQARAGCSGLGQMPGEQPVQQPGDASLGRP